MNPRVTSLNKLKKYNIDPRTNEDIVEEIKKFQKMYTPEWNFTTENPDIGSTIGIVFAKQMEENIRKYNSVMENYRIELVNMLDISLLPAKPARAIVNMSLIQDTIDGATVPAGTSIIAAGPESEEPLIFETEHELYVTGSRLKCAFMTDSDGRVESVYSDLKMQPVFPPEDEEEREKETDEEFKPFGLFSLSRPIGEKAIVFFSENLFDVGKNDFFIRVNAPSEFISEITQKKYVFEYMCENELQVIEKLEVMNDGKTFRMKLEKKPQEYEFGDKKYMAIALVAAVPVYKTVEIEDVTFASVGKPKAIDFAGNGSNDFNVKKFEPFSDTLSLYNECYFGMDEYFSKAGANIKIEFKTEFKEHRIYLTPVEENEQLTVIKKKPRTTISQTMSECYAEAVTVEYYNGIGWKRIESNDVQAVFASGEAGSCEIVFEAPDDWEAYSVGSYDGRSLRIQLLKSDNCYLRPCIHHYPIITDCKVSYSYDRNYRKADRAEIVASTRKEDVTSKYRQGSAITAFRENGYAEGALYLGFTKKMCDGPIGLYFEIEETAKNLEIPTKFEYSGKNGFKQMRVLDYTGNFSHSGVVMFMPPEDMSKMNLESNNLFWIRIIDNLKNNASSVRPVIKSININAVPVLNISTEKETDYFVDEVKPDMKFILGSSDIYDAEVWVNESGTLSKPSMLEMLRDMPEKVRAEYDMLGEISAFYVLYSEADNFNSPKDRRIYVLDRMNSTIAFGDGVGTMIPRVTEGVALKVKLRICKGQKGNVGAGAISEFKNNILFIDSVNNPMRAFGGSNVEDLDSALLRGSDMFASRGRLVSLDDYKKAVFRYSDNISDVSVITGETVDGRHDDNRITAVVLMKDYMDGSYSFHAIKEGLKQYLDDRSEASVTKDVLDVAEPVFVKVSVDVWAEVADFDDNFTVQNMLKETLTEYLSPISTENHAGFRIGTLPRISQIRMRLGSLKNKVLIQKILVTGSYSDHDGLHEVDLEEIKTTPFMVCVSGEHHVHMQSKNL